MSVRGENQNQDDASIEAAPSFRVLKTVVILMGLVIVAGFIFVAVTIYTRARDSAGQTGDVRTADFGAGDFGAGDFRTEVAVPAGELLEVTVGGGQIVLRYRGPDGGERLVLVDQATGRRAGTVTLVPQP
ncbi:MAG: hypothetical protein IID55_02310 [Proteobacteria bacterium]|nr:hypothetical protein [Pseudomonadota bacterium]